MKYSFLFFLVFAGAVFVLVKVCFEDPSEPVEQPDIRSNAWRSNAGIPIIESHWIKESLGKGHVKWHDGVRGLPAHTAVHLYKEITCDAGQISLEKDAFHFEFADSVQYRLLVFHQYRQAHAVPERAKNELIVYEPRKFPPSRSKVLSRQEADSVLQAWAIEM